MTRTIVPYSVISTSPFLEPGSSGERNLRQAFLRSYTFSVQESYGERLKRRLKALNERGKSLFTEFRDRIAGGRRGMSVFRTLRSRLPGPPELNPLRCLGVQKSSYCLNDLDW